MRKTKPQGKGIVRALHQKGTTGNFAKIAKAKGKGAAIGALQNKLAKVRGQKVPYGGKRKRKAMPSDGYRKAKRGAPASSRNPFGTLKSDKGRAGLSIYPNVLSKNSTQARLNTGKTLLAKAMKRLAK